MMQQELFSKTDWAAKNNAAEIKRLQQRRKSTSRSAYEKLADQMPELRAKVFRYLLARGDEGATDEEGQAETGLSPNTYRPRRRELTDERKYPNGATPVVDSGRRRKTKGGNPATVWVAKGDRM